MIVRLAGCRSRPLMGYLKALGVLRTVARQADARTSGRWRDGVFELRGALDQAGLETFFLEQYAPTPIVAPWNGGSGFFHEEGFSAIEASADARFADFRAAIVVGRATLERLGIVAKPGDQKTKTALLRELRGHLPDTALEWLDAAVVLAGSEPAYPPLLGSGGNDGRYDFANNYAQATSWALAAEADAAARERAARWLVSALQGQPVTLRKMSGGHFLRDASPVMSPLGESDGLGNPWDLVLALEGALLLAAGVARRHGSALEAGLAAPFTVRSTGAGYGSAVSGEKGRAELWLPLWPGFATLGELDSTVREGRAQVGRRSARTGLDLARAVGELGIARGISSFERYALLERAGQSSLAVSAGRLEVRARPAVAALRTLDPWLDRVLRYGRGDCPVAHRNAAARLEHAAFKFAENGHVGDAQDVLVALGRIESTLAHSGARAAKAGLAPLDRAAAEPWLDAADDGSAEFVLAAALSSLHDDWSRALPAPRDYLHGTIRSERERREYGPRLGSAVPSCADALARLAALHARRHLDVAKEGRRATSSSASLAFTYGLPCPLGALRKLAARRVDIPRLGLLLDGLVLLDFAGARWSPPKLEARPEPVLELLLLAWAGTPERPLGPRQGWARRLAVGAVEPVARDALLRLRLAGIVPLIERGDLELRRSDGRALAAALLAHLTTRDRWAIARRVAITEPTTIQETDHDRVA